MPIASSNRIRWPARCCVATLQTLTRFFSMLYSAEGVAVLFTRD
jgi:hypothetical protein